jgi:hypothetical protein
MTASEAVERIALAEKYLGQHVECGDIWIHARLVEEVLQNVRKILAGTVSAADIDHAPKPRSTSPQGSCPGRDWRKP